MFERVLIINIVIIIFLICASILIMCICSVQIIIVDIKSLNNGKHNQGRKHRTSAITYQRQCHPCKRDKLTVSSDCQKKLYNVYNPESVNCVFHKGIIAGMCDMDNFQK